MAKDKEYIQGLEVRVSRRNRNGVVPGRLLSACKRLTV